MDPDPAADGAGAAELGADRIELYTEPYARAFGTPRQDEVLGAYARRRRARAASSASASTPATT